MRQIKTFIKTEETWCKTQKVKVNTYYNRMISGYCSQQYKGGKTHNTQGSTSTCVAWQQHAITNVIFALPVQEWHFKCGNLIAETVLHTDRDFRSSSKVTVVVMRGRGCHMTLNFYSYACECWRRSFAFCFGEL